MLRLATKVPYTVNANVGSVLSVQAPEFNEASLRLQAVFAEKLALLSFTVRTIHFVFNQPGLESQDSMNQGTVVQAKKIEEKQIP